MIKSSHVQEDTVPLTEEQKIMLVMSEYDIQAGRTLINSLSMNVNWKGSKEIETNPLI